MDSQATTKDLSQINQSFETRAAEDRAQDLDMPFVDLLNYPLNPDVLKLVSAQMAEQAGAVPFFKNGREVRLATTNPQSEDLKIIVHDLEKERYAVKIYLCAQSGLEKVMEMYASDLMQRKQVELRSDFKELTKLEASERFKGFKSLLAQLELVPVTQALNEIQIAAIQVQASDIHLQPYEDHGDLRFRIDGVLHTVGVIPNDKVRKIVAQIKYEGGMKANITEVPQDGHIAFMANNRKIDLRISSLPTEFGESIVMRVLDSGRGIKSFTELGFDTNKEGKILDVLTRKNGMVLVTGPTGSGKTTTLYAMLKELNTPDKKLVTLEDPIEYHLDNVTQSQVSSQGQYNFGNGLKALLRHDPDVMLIGEIRDLSTAKLATEASLTGHVVLSSLHTNSALGAITRLRNLGLESFNIASSLNAVFAQRLVRRVCPHCAQKHEVNLVEDKRLQTALDRVKKVHPDLTIKLSPDKKDVLETVSASTEGCDQCAQTGFLGQTVIAEVVNLAGPVQEALTKESTESELEKLVRTEDPTFLTLFEDGVRKLIIGETTLAEVYRVAG